MTKLRKAARGRPCMLRLPLICDGGGETTVLAHLRRAGLAGIGQKPIDLAGIWCCGPCHDRLDRRAGLEAVPVEYALDGLLRTLDALVREGLVR